MYKIRKRLGFTHLISALIRRVVNGLHACTFYGVTVCVYLNFLLVTFSRHLHAAIVRGFVEVALALIRAAPHPRLLDTPNDAALTPLHLAVATGQHPVVRWLIIAGARPSPRNSEVSRRID